MIVYAPCSQIEFYFSLYFRRETGKFKGTKSELTHKNRKEYRTH